jgi:hypothetical protein
MKDIRDPAVYEAAYDLLIFDGARDLAVEHGRDTQSMERALQDLGIPQDRINAVLEAQNSADYYENLYRGEMCDEGVIETLKDCLRPLNGF